MPCNSDQAEAHRARNRALRERRAARTEAKKTALMTKYAEMDATLKKAANKDTAIPTATKSAKKSKK